MTEITRVPIPGMDSCAYPGSPESTWLGWFWLLLLILAAVAAYREFKGKTNG